MCDEKLNLVELLGNCPKGTKLYSIVHGEVELLSVGGRDKDYPICVSLGENKSDDYTSDGRIYANSKGECVLFPSKECRDWSKFRLDLPVDTLCAVCDHFGDIFYFHQMIIRRYAGEYKCFNNNGGSTCYDKVTAWRHIIPLDKLMVDPDGTVKLNKKDDYGTGNYIG